MADLNSYANELMLDFIDEMHHAIKETLRAVHGDAWFRRGVKPYLSKQYFDSTREMLESPMRTVDMGKSEDELYGVEHLNNILEGNWQHFGTLFDKQERCRVYLSEIAELRHNLAHRRKHHILRPAEVSRFVSNAGMLLRCIDSPQAPRFQSAADSLASGAQPWGPSLHTALPSRDEIVTDFVGRKGELDELREWFEDSTTQLLVWGYGGAGKSATVYEFARTVADAAPTILNAVIWISAKRQEYIEGAVRATTSDFHDLDGCLAAIWSALYGTVPEASNHVEAILDELNQTPILLVVDDLDTVLDDDDLADFLIFQLRRSASRIVFTSRNKIPGVSTVEIKGFSGRDLERFIRNRCHHYQLDPAPLR